LIDFFSLTDLYLFGFFLFLFFFFFFFFSHCILNTIYISNWNIKGSSEASNDSCALSFVEEKRGPILVEDSVDVDVHVSTESEWKNLGEGDDVGDDVFSTRRGRTSWAPTTCRVSLPSCKAVVVGVLKSVVPEASLAASVPLFFPDTAVLDIDTSTCCSVSRMNMARLK
jgi:hypothetical protein